MRRVAVAVVLAILAAGCGSDPPDMVWCVGPDEQVTEQFKREYPELHMTRAACDAFERAYGG